MEVLGILYVLNTVRGIYRGVHALATTSFMHAHETRSGMDVRFNLLFVLVAGDTLVSINTCWGQAKTTR
jgi:hypothetical protein